MTLPVFSFTVSESIVRVRDRFKFLSRTLFLEWRYFHPNFLVFLEKCGWGCSIFRVCLFSISSSFVSFSFSSTNIKNRWNYCKIWFCKSTHVGANFLVQICLLNCLPFMPFVLLDVVLPTPGTKNPSVGSDSTELFFVTNET